MIYYTTFNTETKVPTAASVPMGVKTMAEAERLMGGVPVKRTPNTLIYDGGVCVSWVRFSIPIDILES